MLANRPAPAPPGNPFASKDWASPSLLQVNTVASANKNAGSLRREPAFFIQLKNQPRFLPSNAWYSSLSPSTPTTRLCSCSTSLWPVW